MGLHKDFDDSQYLNIDDDLENLEPIEDPEQKKRIRRMIEDRLERKRLREELEDEFDSDFDWDDFDK